MATTMPGSGQAALGLECTEPPLALMREAYERCRLRVSFERALDTPHLHTCLRNVALSLGRRKSREARR